MSRANQRRISSRFCKWNEKSDETKISFGFGSSNGIHPTAWRLRTISDHEWVETHLRIVAVVAVCDKLEATCFVLTSSVASLVSAVAEWRLRRCDHLILQWCGARHLQLERVRHQLHVIGILEHCDKRTQRCTVSVRFFAQTTTKCNIVQRWFSWVLLLINW